MSENVQPDDFLAQSNIVGDGQTGGDFIQDANVEMQLDGKVEFGLESGIEYDEDIIVLEEIGADGKVNIMGQVPDELIDEANKQFANMGNPGDILNEIQYETNNILDVLNESCGEIELEDSAEGQQVEVNLDVNIEVTEEPKKKDRQNECILQLDVSNPDLLEDDGNYQQTMDMENALANLNKSVNIIEDDDLDLNDKEVDNCLDLLNKSLAEIEGL